MASARLLGLPIELLTSIIEYISRPSDLKALCLVSRQVSELVMPVLYRDIYLPYDEKDKDWTKVKLLAKSRGVADGHVRSIDIGFCDYLEQRPCKALRRLIRNLPKDTLRRFHYGPLARPEHEDLRHLWQNQGSLTNLLFDFSLMSPSISDIVSEDMKKLSSLGSVSELNINFGNETPEPRSAKELCTITRAMPNLRKIILRLVNTWSKVPITSFSIQFPSALTQISLWYMEFSPGEPWPLHEQRALTHLELNHCQNVVETIDNFSGLTLESFTYSHLCSYQGKEEGAPAAITRLLKRSKPLKRLAIDCTNCITDQEERHIIAAMVAGHAETLEYLLITRDTGMFGYYGWRPIFEAVSKCKGLKELGVLIGIGNVTKACVDFINSLPRLLVLNIFDSTMSLWPESDDEESVVDHDVPMDGPYYAQEICKQIIPSSRIKILSFGKNFLYGDWMERHQHPRRPVHQCFLLEKVAYNCYKPAKRRPSRFTPVPIDFSQVKYIEPWSDMLQHILCDTE